MANANTEIFDLKRFKQQLAKTDSAIHCFRAAITKTRVVLDERFKSKANIEDIISDLTHFIDQILVVAWQQYDWDDQEDISLLAVGGYGRGELHPYSDIDIQILLAKNNPKKYKTNIEHFLTFLWDINLEVGQSVRTISENKKLAAKDITIATALMESRTVFGNPELHKKLILEVSKKKIWDAKKFFTAKRNEQISRHAKYDDVEYALEPNLKVSPGGLRDIQTIGWISKRYFGASDFQELVERGFLQKNEYQDLIKGRNFLWSLRYGLHMLAGRREDRLLFEHQRKLAEIFSYKDDKNSLGIEKLMKEYYRNVQTLRELNDVLLQLFDEEIIRSKEKAKILTLNARFQIHNNYIEAVHSRVFRQTPFALLEIFVLFAQNEKIEGIRASTIRLIRNGRQLIDDDFRKDIRNTSLFMELIRSPYKIVARLRQMKRYGILGAYLPEFGKIIGQMQHDLFHIYSVDDHTLQVVENMRRLHHPEAEEKYPLAAGIIKTLPKVELLYIAGLYHDIAKGRGGDHSVLGVKDAEDFCIRHHLGKWDTALVAWLVKNHLFMSSIAQRQDIQDPDVIKSFALVVGDQTHLDYLYTLTVADINATNPKLWNAWRASLLRQLYQATKRALSLGLEKVVGKSSRIKDTQNQALAILSEKDMRKKQALSIWDSPTEDYFLRESPEDIAWQTLAISKHEEPDTPLILIKNSAKHQSEGATQVFIYTQDSHFLFANIANAFDKLNLNIQNARLFSTASKKALVTFMVLETNGTLIKKNSPRIVEIISLLKEYSLPIERPAKTKQRASRQLRHFSRATETSFTNPENFPYSILEVLCPDRPGLLAKIANIFVDKKIILHNAKITTLGENVEDVFFIADNSNKPITNKKVSEELQALIKQKLDATLNAA
ncbi:MAG: [protein-PII] uridylyltransferase [SAR86 cluster bacterium]|uniref:Bifunctional uridylyltransferase/uridylyl-removing enzyme n=1 Tax=SAR86 cluster bacterium TaxID=2030880 RepID=A0A2A5C9E3_9GAMM|nr:MAG: [protein-PII] uridylyltransferase [SAR86 cluster bacterium]